MQYINKDPDLGSSWDYSFNYNSGNGSNGSSGGGKAIWEEELIALA